MKTVHVMVGLPATGKTHICKQLKQKYPSAVLFSTDDYIMKVAQEKNTTYSEVFVENIGRAIQQADLELRYAIKHDRNIIWDKPNLTQTERAAIIRRMKITGYQMVAHVIRTPETEQQMKEWQNRLNSGTQKQITEKVLKKMIDSYTYPSEKEGWNQICYYDLWSELQTV